ncbi:MarR family winged helix-turn-helix transcriptional regulator [Roseibium marinum]|uniref:DNA-binding MarR family transcriptional regulator n=1 Tax=Roseibium marinum TaxID=281252 RepID=A0A2S3UTB9_9HYPH|nr:MarR family transcriptional regulator [Roseibium marinum]POF30904.1 DNA-binding MarR family transcriptional regulator [Roseibium marinum]
MSILEFPAQQDDNTAEPLNFGSQEQAAGFVLRIAQLAAFERFFALFPAHDIKISEYSVLVGIALNPGVRQGVLADFLKIKWSNMTKLVRTLEDRTLIGRRVPKNDRRSVELYVTEEGHKLIDSVSQDMETSDRKAFQMLSDDEHTQLLVLLRKVAGWPPRGADAKGPQ